MLKNFITGAAAGQDDEGFNTRSLLGAVTTTLGATGRQEARCGIDIVLHVGSPQSVGVSPEHAQVLVPIGLGASGLTGYVGRVKEGT